MYLHGFDRIVGAGRGKATTAGARGQDWQGGGERPLIHSHDPNEHQRRQPGDEFEGGSSGHEFPNDRRRKKRCPIARHPPGLGCAGRRRRISSRAPAPASGSRRPGRSGGGHIPRGHSLAGAGRLPAAGAWRDCVASRRRRPRWRQSHKPAHQPEWVARDVSTKG